MRPNRMSGAKNGANNPQRTSPWSKDWDGKSQKYPEVKNHRHRDKIPMFFSAQENNNKPTLLVGFGAL